MSIKWTIEDNCAKTARSSSTAWRTFRLRSARANIMDFANFVVSMSVLGHNLHMLIKICMQPSRICKSFS